MHIIFSILFFNSIVLPRVLNCRRRHFFDILALLSFLVYSDNNNVPFSQIRWILRFIGYSPNSFLSKLHKNVFASILSSLCRYSLVIKLSVSPGFFFLLYVKQLFLSVNHMVGSWHYIIMSCYYTSCSFNGTR